MAGSEPAIVVCDAGPIIHLDDLKCLDLLAYYETIYVPKAVWTEVRRHRPSALRRRRVTLTVVEEIPEAHLELEVLIRAFSLNQGEIEALRLTTALPKATLMTDDAAARLVAEQLGYEVHGSIGIIVAAAPRNQRTVRQVLNLLKSIPRRSSLHIRKGFWKAIIEQVERSL